LNRLGVVGKFQVKPALDPAGSKKPFIFIGNAGVENWIWTRPGDGRFSVSSPEYRHEGRRGYNPGPFPTQILWKLSLFSTLDYETIRIQGDFQ